MGKTRLEAFSDGVIAILITMMVLEFKTPASHDWAALRDLSPKFCAYLLSFTVSSRRSLGHKGHEELLLWSERR